MDLQAITRMLTSRNIKVLHLEPTDVCQAACPLCARETVKNFDKSKKHYVKVEYLDYILPEGFVANLDKMFMCGNYGDPAASYYTLDIYEYFRKLNPTIALGMNTNGALQSTFWWHQLAKILNQQQDYVVFSIDGLEDTNSDYRVNVNWNKLMANVEAFIAAGGQAHWDMLVYKHNQHQVDACEELARKLGFKWFRAKVSRRPLVGRLEAPINWQRPNVITGDISCHALKEQSVFINAQGAVSPCCWIGVERPALEVSFDDLQESWASTSPNPVCARTCAVDHSRTNFSGQWQREIALQQQTMITTSE